MSHCCTGATRSFITKNMGTVVFLVNPTHHSAAVKLTRALNVYQSAVENRPLLIQDSFLFEYHLLKNYNAQLF